MTPGRRIIFYSAAAALFSFFYYETDPHILYHADSLYAAWTSYEFFTEGLRISDIRFTPSPYYFPDLILYSLIYNASGNLFLSQYLWALFQTFLTAAIAAKVMLRLYKENYYEYFALFLILPFAAFRFSPLVSVFLPGMHFAVLPVTLILFLTVTAENGRKSFLLTGAASLLVLVTSMSDPLFAVSAGLLFTALLLSPGRYHYIKKSAVPAAGLGAGILLYFILKDVMNVSDLPAVNPSLTDESFRKLMQDLKENVITSATGIFILFCGVLSYAAVIFRFRSAWKGQDSAELSFFYWYLMYFPVSLVLPVVTGTYQDLYSLRYMILPFFISLPVLFRINNKNKKYIQKLLNRPSRPYLIIPLVTLFLLYSVYKAAVFRYDPPDYRCAAELTRDQRIKTGTGGFWPAMRITLLSAQYNRKPEDRIRIYKEDDPRAAELPEPAEKTECSPWNFRIWIYKQ